MLRKSKRTVNRLDYKLFNSTGEIVTTSTQSDDQEISNLLNNLKISENMPDQNDDYEQLVIDESICSDKINDFIDVNQADVINSVESCEECLALFENLCDNFRFKHKKLSIKLKDQYEETYGKLYIEKMDGIKAFIKKVKIHKNVLLKELEESQVEKQVDVKTQENIINERKCNFMIGEVDRNISSLQTLLTMEEEESDDEIRRRKEEMNDQLKQIQSISKMLMELYEKSINEEMNKVVDQLNKRYEVLLKLKSIDVKKVNDEMKAREIDKKKAFNTSLLNIKMSKFKGFESNCDVYTFKTQFEKLYLKSTPVELLPDLIKNNFLENPALLLVKNCETMDEIWSRLVDAYGDQKTMLSKKLAEINKLESAWKSKNSEKIVENLTKIINVMKDLLLLAENHDLETQLFHGDALDQLYKLSGDSRVMRWLSVSCEDKKEGKDEWNQLIKFLERDIKIHQQKLLLKSKASDEKSKPKIHQSSSQNHFAKDSDGNKGTANQQVTNSCFICGDVNHVVTNGSGGMKIVQYFVCRKFVEMSPAQRFDLLRSKGFCFQCLYPGADWKGRHRQGRCQKEFICKDPSHDHYPAKKHFLVCEEHKTSPENQKLLQEYKDRFILRQRHIQLPSFSKELDLNYHTSSYRNKAGENNELHEDSAIYMLQTIQIDGKLYSIFYDSGCNDFISRFDAVRNLGNRAVQVCPGPIRIGGVGGISTETPHGIFNVSIPLKNGNDAKMSGICMNKITATFPTYPLREVGKDIREAFKKNGGDMKTLPSLPESVGNDTDFMIGVKYLKYFPEQIFQLPSGLTIYKSCFRNIDGSDGVIGGPHQVFTNIENQHHIAQGFINNQFNLYKFGYQVNLDVPLLAFKDKSYDINHDIEKINITDQPNHVTVHSIRKLKQFNKIEHAGSEIKYRCVKCRSCLECKNHDINETLSIKEEVEQDLIDRSVKVDIERCVTTANFPLLQDPTTKLCPNKDKALKVYKQQIKKLVKK